MTHFQVFLRECYLRWLPWEKWLTLSANGTTIWAQSRLSLKKKCEAKERSKWAPTFLSVCLLIIWIWATNFLLWLLLLRIRSMLMLSPPWRNLLRPWVKISSPIQFQVGWLLNIPMEVTRKPRSPMARTTLLLSLKSGAVSCDCVLCFFHFHIPLIRLKWPFLGTHYYYRRNARVKGENPQRCINILQKKFRLFTCLRKWDDHKSIRPGKWVLHTENQTLQVVWQWRECCFLMWTKIIYKKVEPLQFIWLVTMISLQAARPCSILGARYFIGPQVFLYPNLAYLFPSHPK